MVMVKASKGLLEIFKIVGGESIATGDVTKVQKGREALDHLTWHMAGDSSKIDLKSMIDQIGHITTTNDEEVTFMSALESSPVHWAKSRPSGKRRSPGKGGTAEILELPALNKNINEQNRAHR
jgi:hypothetical protein